MEDEWLWVWRIGGKLTRKIKVFWEKPIPMPLCVPGIPTWPTLQLNPDVRGEISVTAWYKLLGSLWRKGEHILVAINVAGSLCTILGCCIIQCTMFKTTQRIVEFSAAGMLFSTMNIARPISRTCHVKLKNVIRIALSYYLCTK